MINTISFFNNKFGWISAIENNGKIIEVKFKKGKKTQFVTKKLKTFKKEIELYLNSKKNNLKAPLKLQGNNKQIKIWRELQKIRPGQTKSYGEIAKICKCSPRYVGKVCGQNRILILVPCHRVIRSNGSLGGFSARGGIKTKKKLLELEIKSRS